MCVCDESNTCEDDTTDIGRTVVDGKASDLSVVEALHEQELTIYETGVDYELFDIDEFEEEVIV